MVWHLNRFDGGWGWRWGSRFFALFLLCIIFTFFLHEVERCSLKSVYAINMRLSYNYTHTLYHSDLLTLASLENKVMELIWWRAHSNFAASDWLLRMHTTDTYAYMSRSHGKKNEKKCNIIIIAFHPLIKSTIYVYMECQPKLITITTHRTENRSIFISVRYFDYVRFFPLGTFRIFGNEYGW